jgi:hypothetical protein
MDPWPPFSRFLNDTHRHTEGFLQTSDQPVAEASTTQGNTAYKHNRQTSMLRAGFETATPATKRPQTYALDSSIDYINKYAVLPTDQNTYFLIDADFF